MRAKRKSSFSTHSVKEKRFICMSRMMSGKTFFFFRLFSSLPLFLHFVHSPLLPPSLGNVQFGANTSA
jgi:hypothetical protein